MVDFTYYTRRYVDRYWIVLRLQKLVMLNFAFLLSLAANNCRLTYHPNIALRAFVTGAL